MTRSNQPSAEAAWCFAEAAGCFAPPGWGEVGSINKNLSYPRLQGLVIVPPSLDVHVTQKRLWKSHWRVRLLPNMTVDQIMLATFSAALLQHKIHNISLPNHFQLCCLKSFALLYSILAFSPFWLLKLWMGTSLSIYLSISSSYH